MVSIYNIYEEDDLTLPARHYPPLRHLPAALRGEEDVERSTNGRIDRLY